MYRNSRFYLAVNHLSDWTPRELKRMRNKRIADRFEKERKQAVPAEKLDGVADFLPTDVENVEEALKELVGERQEQPGFKELHEAMEANGGGVSRRKRNAGDGEAKPLRELPLDKLINTEAQVRLPAAEGQRARRERQSILQAARVAKSGSGRPDGGPFGLGGDCKSDARCDGAGDGCVAIGPERCPRVSFVALCARVFL